MLFIVLKRLIEKGQIDGLAERIDVLYAVGKLTDAEYNTLINMLEEVVE